MSIVKDYDSYLEPWEFKQLQLNSDSIQKQLTPLLTLEFASVSKTSIMKLSTFHSGSRVAYSVYGHTVSLSGEPETEVVVEAVGQGPECDQYQEEAVSDAQGSFRIRGLYPKVNLCATSICVLCVLLLLGKKSPILNSFPAVLFVVCER